MGMIQNSLNQLSLSILGTVGGIGHVLKGSFKKPKAPGEEEKPAVETTSAMGNIAKIGKNYANTNMRSYVAAARAMDSGNDAIAQKAVSHYDPIKTRLEQLKEATSLTIQDEEKGGSK